MRHCIITGVKNDEIYSITAADTNVLFSDVATMKRYATYYPQFRAGAQDADRGSTADPSEVHGGAMIGFETGVGPTEYVWVTVSPDPNAPTYQPPPLYVSREAYRELSSYCDELSQKVEEYRKRADDIWVAAQRLIPTIQWLAKEPS